MILCISAVSVVTSPFSFLILLIWVLSLFFLLRLTKGLSILFIFSKNQLLVLLIFAIVFFVSISFTSALDLYDFFPSTNFGFCLFFFFLFCFLRFHMWDIRCLSFCISLSIMPSRSTHVVANGKIFFFYGWITFHLCVCVCVCVHVRTPHFLYPFIHWWTLKLLPNLGHC